MGAGALLTLELDCRWGEEKVEEKGTSGGDIESRRDTHTQEKKVKKETLEPEHKETTTRNQ